MVRRLSGGGRGARSSLVYLNRRMSSGNPTSSPTVLELKEMALQTTMTRESREHSPKSPLLGVEMRRCCCSPATRGGMFQRNQVIRICRGRFMIRESTKGQMAPATFSKNGIDMRRQIQSSRLTYEAGSTRRREGNCQDTIEL